MLAVDLGTTGIKAAVVDAEGRVLATAGEVLPLLHVADGGVEQDPEHWWAALGRVARHAVAHAGVRSTDIGTVAVTSQFMTTVPVAADGTPVGNAIMWMDKRGHRHTDVGERHEHLGTWLDVHGMPPSSDGDLGHVALLRAERPDVYAAAHALVEPMDHLAARLTGRVTATQCTSFPMQCVDNRTWGAVGHSGELLALSGVDPAKLAPLVPMGEPRGTLTRPAAEHLGLREGTPVADATIDSVTSAVGTGAVDASRVGLVIGTTSVMVTHVPTKREDLDHGLITAPSPLPGQWFVVAENGIGGKALDVVVNQVLRAGEVPGDPYERLLAEAAGVAPGAEGVLFLPWLAGSMAPRFDDRARGAFVNLGLTTERAHLVRAVLEGVALGVAWLAPHVVALAGHGAAAPAVDGAGLTFGGGGAASPLWGQVLADVTGLTVHRVASARATNAHGAALLALVQAGRCALHDVPDMLSVAEVHEPDPAAHRLLGARLSTFTGLHDTVTALHHALAPPEDP